MSIDATSTLPGPERTRDEAVADLGAQADARWAELDADRRLPADLFHDVLAAGLFRALVPAGMGGTGGTPLEWFRAGVELARHDPSLGWVVTQGAAELGWIAAGADPAWAAEVLADPTGASASSSAGLGELALDGPTAHLAGRWRFNTGCHGATWIGGMALVKGESGPDGMPVIRWGWVPAHRAEIVDDWDTSGLRGTGSNSTVIPAQEIDPAWTFSPFDVTPLDRGTHRVLVGNGNWPIATSVAATLLGAARRALDEAARLVPGKAPMPDFTPLVENAAVQRTLVRAEARWRASVASVERELEATWDEGARLGELTIGRRVDQLLANAVAVEEAVGIVEAMCEVTGTAAVARSHPLSRVRRDAHVLRGHIAVNGATVEAAARMRFGLGPVDRRV